MMSTFWNTRYAAHETVYGHEPNKFFKLFIDLHKPGRILLPAEGEGRNAIYAASKGWNVDAFDFSEVARDKALERAAREGLSLNYRVQDIETFRAEKQYDAVALIYVHLPVKTRKKFHQEMIRSLKPGGFMVLEAFAKEQAGLQSGGPKDENLLYEAASLCEDFQSLHILNCHHKELNLQEGDFHKGQAHVLRLTGQRL